MELADKTDESADDITAADMAPSPTNATAVGVRYCKTNGNTSLICSDLISLVPLTRYFLGTSVVAQSSKKTYLK